MKTGIMDYGLVFPFPDHFSNWNRPIEFRYTGLSLYLQSIPEFKNSVCLQFEQNDLVCIWRLKENSFKQRK